MGVTPGVFCMLEFFTLVFVSVFLAVNAIGSLPLFISLLHKFKRGERIAVIRKSFAIALVSFLVLSLFGKQIFQLMNIKFYSFYIAGGLLLSIISLEMILGKRPETKVSEKEEELLEKRAAELENLAVTPLAIPMLTGPGAITMGLMLFGSIKFTGLLAAVKVLEFLAGAFLAYAASFVIIAKSDIVRKVLGKLGLKVMTRVMGLVLLSIGVQFIVNGVLELITVI